MNAEGAGLKNRNRRTELMLNALTYIPQVEL
jgi:hypothetical protein